MVTAEVSPNKPVQVHYIVSETSSGDGDFIVPLEEGVQDELLDFSFSVKVLNLQYQLLMIMMRKRMELFQ